jgi:hypothetical protein
MMDWGTWKLLAKRRDRRCALRSAASHNLHTTRPFKRPPPPWRNGAGTASQAERGGRNSANLIHGQQEMVQPETPQRDIMHSRAEGDIRSDKSKM